MLTALKDDGFYFLTLARNIAEGHGATFDGIAPTNGFHPLWTLLLAPIFLLPATTPFTAVRWTLVLATLLHLGAGLAVYRAARVATDRAPARLAALAYLGNPLAGYLVVSGMESTLVALLVALLAGEAALVQAGQRRLDRWGRIALLGILSGLAMLARTDLVLLVGPILLGLIVLRPEGSVAPFRARIRGPVLAGTIAAAVVLPWLVWNLVRFGTIVQVSARAHHLHSVSQRLVQGGEEAKALWNLGPGLIASLFQRISARTSVPLSVLGLVGLAILSIVAFWVAGLLMQPEIRRDIRSRITRVLAPLIYAIGFLFATFFILGHIRSWYIAGPLAVAGILMAIPAYLAVGAAPISGIWRVLSRLIFLGIVLVTAPLWFTFGQEVIHNARSAPAWKEASEWVAARTEPHDRVASFNSGAFGYLAPRTVVNLDCVVNNRAIDWLERRELIEYLWADRIRYVIDEPWYVEMYFRDYAVRDWKERISVVDHLQSGLRVYEVRPP